MLTTKKEPSFRKDTERDRMKGISGRGHQLFKWLFGIKIFWRQVLLISSIEAARYRCNLDL